MIQDLTDESGTVEIVTKTAAKTLLHVTRVTRTTRRRNIRNITKAVPPKTKKKRSDQEMTMTESDTAKKRNQQTAPIQMPTTPMMISMH